MGTAVQPSELVQQPAVDRVIVVKLGGSVVRGGTLHGWLDVIAAAPHPVVLVPGGGALADEVRQCQTQLGFGEATAHRMALLAMDQLAWALAGMKPGFEVGTTFEELRAISRGGRVAVWAPSALIAERTDVEATWRLTSDSLAVWLAGKIGAAACCVVKAVPVGHGVIGAATLSQEGIVDDAFPAMLSETGIATSIFGRGDEKALASYLAGECPALRVVTV